MKYDLIIFDLDGTLLNTLEDLTDSVNYAMRSLGFPERSIDEVNSFIGNGNRKLLKRKTRRESWDALPLAFRRFLTVSSFSY